MGNIVAIVGRPNVGKSTLFNRLVEQRQAIMDNTSGVTRDRHYGHAEWTGRQFTVIDTGGYLERSDDVFESAIRSQVALALEEAAVVLFMVDTDMGLTGDDQDFAKVVREVGKPTLVVANKADNTDRQHLVGEFYGLGLGEVHAVSAANGSGTGDLLDRVVELLPPEADNRPDEGIPKIAILGRPNAGKSSFLNALLGKERSMVTDIAGTTRDAIHSRYKLYGLDFMLIDTAGLRRKGRVTDKIEFYSTMRAIKALEDADVCIVVIDAVRGLESQDINIIALAHRQRKGIVLMVNKWDLIEKDSRTADQFRKEMLGRLAPLDYMPVLFTSVVDKQRIFQVMEAAAEVVKQKARRLKTSELNNKLLPLIERQPPPAVRGKHIKINYITQLPIASPTFAFFTNFPKHIKKPYERYLENQIRKIFGFSGVSIKIVFRKK